MPNIDKVIDSLKQTLYENQNEALYFSTLEFENEYIRLILDPKTPGFRNI